MPGLDPGLYQVSKCRAKSAATNESVGPEATRSSRVAPGLRQSKHSKLFGREVNDCAKIAVAGEVYAPDNLSRYQLLNH